MQGAESNGSVSDGWLLMRGLQYKAIPKLVTEGARDLRDGVLAEENEAPVFLGGREEVT